jgi:hypothetical protein
MQEDKCITVFKEEIVIYINVNYYFVTGLGNLNGKTVQ